MSQEPDGRLVSARVPESFQQAFYAAQEHVLRYFAERRDEPARGSITVSGDRYILVRAASLSTEFFDLVTSLHHNLDDREAWRVGTSFLFDLAHTLGKSDARHFHRRMGVSDPVEKLSAGPVHFAHTGWAFVNILPESHVSADESFCLIYDHHQSFEADSWLQAGRHPPLPACTLNAGYSSGWCEESFGVTLVAVELTCRAMGADRCRFIMAPPDRIEGLIERHRAGEPPEHPSVSVDIPAFFERERLRVQLRRERDFSNAVLDTAGALVLVLDRAGRIVRFNRACEAASGYSSEEATGRILWELVQSGPEAQSARETFAEMVEGHVPRSSESCWETKQGDHRWIAWSHRALPDENGRAEHIVSAGLDITERRRLEQELAGKVRRLSEVNAELDAFAYSVSHDLRTPLRTMEGFARALLDDHAAGLDPDGLEFARRIVRSARDMDDLIRDLLAYSRLSQEEIHPEKVALGPLVHNVLTKLEAPIQERDARVRLDEPLPVVRGHHSTLFQVMENLLTNAIKFVSPGTRPRLHIGAEHRGGMVRIHVEDNGIGIEPREFERIFQALERLHGPEEYPGSGIGLALVAKGVDRMGGRVGVESTPGQGSRFWIELPAAN